MNQEQKSQIGASVGERRVRVAFNPTSVSLVAEIKEKTAELINILEYEKNVEKASKADMEKFRLIALAQTAYEEAAMWAEKAVTA
jgi:hypothetical protein